eukprot:2317670-Prorocentrum_lima.AAC.1
MAAEAGVLLQHLVVAGATRHIVASSAVALWRAVVGVGCDLPLASADERPRLDAVAEALRSQLLHLRPGAD